MNTWNLLVRLPMGLIVLAACAMWAQTVPNIKDTQYCPNYPSGRPPLTAPSTATGDLRKVVINAPNAVCNDGSPAVMYVRSARAGATEPDGSSANRWVIHFEGGGSCESFEDCGARWCGIGFYTAEKMSSTPARESIGPGGLFRRNSLNPLGDRNQVILNYCSSDEWQGRKSDVVLRSETDSRAYSLHYQGATIASAAFDALERGVPGLPRLTDATDVLISGDSGGSKGARAHLDRLAARLKAQNPAVRVLGMFEASFLPDLNGRQGFPAGDPRDPVAPGKTAEFNRVHVGLRNSLLDDSCVTAHPGAAAYLCGDVAYVEMNHITTPFFQMMDYADENVGELAEGLLTAGRPATFTQVSQAVFDQLGLLANIKNTATERNAMTIAPGVGGRNCGVHVTWADDDGFFGKRIRSAPGATPYSFSDLLWNWMTGGSPTSLLAPRPPDTPAVPLPDSICDARAPNAPAGPTIATASSASYNFAGPVAPDSIVTTFGANLAAAAATATTIPWPTTLGGVTVRVTDSRGTARQAPLYFVSPRQILYLIPTGTAVGAAQVAIGSQTTTVDVTATAPAIYSASQTGVGVAAATYLRITSAGVRSEGLLFDPNTRQDTGVPAAAGDQLYLILYGTGLRGGTATATVGGVQAPVAGPVAQGQYPGLDQINLGPLPLRIGYGQKQIVIRQGDAVANPVSVTFRQP